MNKKIQGFIAGTLLGATIASSLVNAEQISKQVDIFFNNIKLYINGAEIVPKDANGNIVEPFIMNGTTYLPVRAVSNAFGQEVEWDGETQSVYVGKKDKTKPDNYLHKIQYNDYVESEQNDDFSIINGTVADFNKNTYTNGIIFYNYGYYNIIQDDSDDKANILISYPLNSQYKNLKGKIVIPKEYKLNTWNENDNCRNAPTDVWFYGDGKLLYKATAVTASMPFNIDINTNGVNQLTIKLKSQGNSYIALTDMALYK